jgi:hypothetical protein
MNIDEIALKKYPKVGEWSGDEKDWIDGNYQLRTAYKIGYLDAISQNDFKMKTYPDIYYDNLLRKYNADKSLNKNDRYKDI